LIYIKGRDKEFGGRLPPFFPKAHEFIGAVSWISTIIFGRKLKNIENWSRLRELADVCDDVANNIEDRMTAG